MLNKHWRRLPHFALAHRSGRYHGYHHAFRPHYWGEFRGKRYFFRSRRPCWI